MKVSGHGLCAAAEAQPHDRFHAALDPFRTQETRKFKEDKAMLDRATWNEICADTGLERVTSRERCWWQDLTMGDTAAGNDARQLVLHIALAPNRYSGGTFSTGLPELKFVIVASRESGAGEWQVRLAAGDSATKGETLLTETFTLEGGRDQVSRNAILRQAATIAAPKIVELALRHDKSGRRRVIPAPPRSLPATDPTGALAA
jgi:hypothetical protein